MNLDLIRDKGKGVIILLHGVPGVGKVYKQICIRNTPFADCSRHLLRSV